MTATHRPDGTVVLRAPAKLTLELRVRGVRADGYHLIDAEMVTIDLADTLTVRPASRSRASEAANAPGVTTSPDWSGSPKREA